MKKNLIYILPIVLICTLGITLLSTHNSQNTVADRKTPLVSALTRSVELPDEITFAGETTRLDRYDIRERYDREINSFTYFHSTTLLLIKRANRIFPIIEPILKENGIPDDFKYLAVIESSLNPRAYSSAKAAGLWQFIESTAKLYGLETGAEVDERYSIEKSTHAACKYLKNAYAKYGNWTSAALSYNAGMGRITGELEKQLVNDGLDLWLVEETSRYFFRMAAIKNVFESPVKYGFIINSNQLYKPMEFKQVEISETITDLAEFAKKNKITYAQLKDFNSWLRDRKLTIGPKSTKTYTILIPTENSLYYWKGDKPYVHNPNWVTDLLKVT